MTTNALATKSVLELRQLAVTVGIRGVKDLKKHQLISALVQRKAAPIPPIFQKDRPLVSSSSTAMVVPMIRIPSQYPAPASPPEGLPIPDRYGTTRLVIMVQDPHRLFAYWRFDNSQLSEVLHAIQHGSFPVLVLMSNGGMEQRDIELGSGSSYLSVVAKSSYEAALGLRDVDGSVRVLITSNRITMPSNTISPELTATETDFLDPFNELYEMASATTRISSGNSSDRLDDRNFGQVRQPGTLPLGTSSASLIHH
jgi:Domain of unknown function (DUF4912)/Rho termination factor, N-terminal domain